MHSLALLLVLTSLLSAVVSAASQQNLETSALQQATGRTLQVKKSCVCPAVYKPVCGEKFGVRRTYSNSCQAGCDGATVVEQDACSGGTNTQTVRVAGGRRLAAATCICNKIYKPVCGANGRTYGNTCEAACTKVVVRCWGACPCPLCKCTAQYAPVCGADGVTYSNASCKRVPVAYKGLCLGKEGDACGGIAGKRCQNGLICDAPATPDAQGVCKPAPGPADGTLGGKCGGLVGIPCDNGLTCVTPLGTADAFGTCQYVNPVVGEGESCGGFRIGPIPVCAKGLYCKTNPLIADARGVCTPIPQSGAGEPCGGYPPPGTQSPTCKLGLTCKTDPRVPDKPGVCQ